MCSYSILLVSLLGRDLASNNFDGVCIMSSEKVRNKIIIMLDRLNAHQLKAIYEIIIGMKKQGK